MLALHPFFLTLDFSVPEFQWISAWDTIFSALSKVALLAQVTLTWKIPGQISWILILSLKESLEEREGGQTEALLASQLEKDLAGLSAEQVKELVIAYEPIWAIGTGRTATAEVADETCGFIRSKVKELYNEEVAEAVRIQYGGSVKTSNIDELMAKPNIDGALIGGASLKAEDFMTLVNAALK